MSEHFSQKRKTILSDRNSIFIEKNIADYDRISQKKMDLEAEQTLFKEKIHCLEVKIFELEAKKKTG